MSPTIIEPCNTNNAEITIFGGDRQALEQLLHYDQASLRGAIITYIKLQVRCSERKSKGAFIYYMVTQLSVEEDYS